MAGINRSGERIVARLDPNHGELTRARLAALRRSSKPPARTYSEDKNLRPIKDENAVGRGPLSTGSVPP